MLILILGGSGSGKSAYAEQLITDSFNKKTKYYIATMQVYDKEGEKKVKKHRIERAGKGFITVEQPVNVDKALNFINDIENIAILECMSNLTANEMFIDGSVKGENNVIEKIINDIDKLLSRLENLVIVSNNIFEDGINYDETTKSYIRALGKINEILAKKADKVVEVVVGIPIIMKGKNV